MIEEILFTECYTLMDALIWCLLGVIIGAKILKGSRKH